MSSHSSTFWGRLAQLRGWPPGWLSWTSELWLDERVTDENECLKAKMEHLLDQKEKVAPSGGRLAQHRGWPPGWLSWTSELMVMKWVTDEKLWLKAKMEHLLDPKEKVGPSGWRLAQLRGWPPGWLNWTSELMLDDRVTD